MSNAIDLNGKVVFITGAARGIGAAVGAECARRGAKVALTGLEPEELEARAAEIGEAAIHLEADVTDADSLAEAVAETVERLGGIDVVVANAGIASYGTVEKGDVDGWIQTVDINLNGVYRTVRAALPHVLDRSGHICVIASIASFAPLAGLSSYNASKAGVEAFTRSFEQEVAFRGVSAGTVHPSWIDTDLVREAEADLGSFREMRRKLPWPLHKTTTVEECALAIVDAIEARQRRTVVPRTAGLLYWARSLVTSAPGAKAVGWQAKKIVPQMEAEIEALGRSASARTTAINEIGEKTPVA